MPKSSLPAPAFTRLAAYVRVSTEEQKIRGLSIEAQTSALRAWAKEHGATIVGHYNDAGITARKKYSKRPELLRLLSDVEAGKVDLVIFTKLDRWFRNISEYYKVQEILETNGVSWKTIHEDYDTTTASGRLKVNIMLSVAQDEADRDSERIKAVFSSKKDRLEPVTGMVPTGYVIQDKQMQKDPTLESAVSLYFDAYTRLHSITKAREEVKEACGVTFSYQIADSMLRKPAYYGNFNGVEGMCPAYITQEAHDNFAANRRNYERRTIHQRVYLFTGILFCGDCGRRMGARMHRYPRKGDTWGERASYNCAGHYIQTNCSNCVNIGERDIELYLLREADAALAEYIAEVANTYPTTAVKTADEKAIVKKKLSKLKDLYVNDMIDMDVYRKDYEALQAHLAQITIQEQKIATPPNLSRLTSIFSDGWQEMYRSLSPSDRQSFWRIAIERITIHPNRSITFSFLA